MTKRYHQFTANRQVQSHIHTRSSSESTWATFAQRASIATILDVRKCSYRKSICHAGRSISNLHPIYDHSLFGENSLAHKRGRWDLLASTGPTSYIQDRGPLCNCGHGAGVSVRANPLQHTGGGPVVEGQLPGAVAAHPDPHGSQQHGYTGHGPLRLRRHSHVVVGLGL